MYYNFQDKSSYFHFLTSQNFSVIFWGVPLTLFKEIYFLMNKVYLNPKLIILRPLQTLYKLSLLLKNLCGRPCLCLQPGRIIIEAKTLIKVMDVQNTFMLLYSKGGHKEVKNSSLSLQIYLRKLLSCNCTFQMLSK